MILRSRRTSEEAGADRNPALRISGEEPQTRLG